MAGFALSGVFSGIDTDAIVAATIAAARAPLLRLQSQQSTWSAKKRAIGEIERRMEQLHDLVDRIRDANDLRRVNAFSSDRNTVVASASGGATEGIHEIIVNQLASAERQVSAGVTPTEAWTHSLGVTAADDEYLSADDISDGAGDSYRFVFQFGSEDQVTVDLSAYDATGITLNELVGEINTAAGYTAASAVTDGGQYQLRIQAAGEGDDHALAITDDSSVGLLDGTGDFEQTVDGDVGADAIVGAGQFVYTYNGVTRTITTTAETSLGQLRDLIRNDSQNPGVNASILEYQGATDGRYHLVLSGRDTGADYTITVESATTLSGFGPGASNWTRTQQARNAQIRVDGYPADAWIESASNTVTSAIPNVTLDLLATNGAGTVMMAGSSDTAVLTATAQDGAVAGVHEVQVNRLARAERLTHTDGLASSDTALDAGNFVYTYDGVTRTVTSDGTTTLAQFRDLINADALNPGVTASVLYTDGTYHLVLDGEDTGAAYGITIEGGTTISDFGSGDFTETSAQDAQIKVDGFPPGPGDWIERSSNTITDAVPGATLRLQGTGTVTVNVYRPDNNDLKPVIVNLTRDTDELQSDLENLVAIYNGIVDTVQQYAGYDPETQTAGVLIGDSGINLLVGQVRSLLTSRQSGFDSAQDTFTMAADIGIEIDRDGYLSLDTTTLQEAISEDYFGVLELIGAIGLGGSDSSYVQFNSAESSTEAGDYEVEVEFDGAGAITAARVRKQGETEWRDATWNGSVITGGVGNPEQGLQVTFVYNPSLTSPVTANVRVQQGFAGAVYDRLGEFLDAADGPIAIKKERYDRAIAELENRIDVAEDRLVEKEERLREKYARLEATLAQLDSFRAAIDAMYTSLQSLSNAKSKSGRS